MIQIFLLTANIVLINLGFLIAFFIRYGLPFPDARFSPFKSSFIALTLIYILAMAIFSVYKARFKSSWDLFKRVFLGLSIGTLLSVTFIYIFRSRLAGFPTSVFIISFLVNLLIIFKINQFFLKSNNKIKKHLVILGEGKVDDMVGKKAEVEKKSVHQIRDLFQNSVIDEIIISERITDTENLNLLLYLEQKFKAEILFSPSVYMGLMPDKINGNSSVESLATFLGRKPDHDEFFIAILDITASLTLLVLTLIPMLIISILIKLTSKGSIFYTQKRVGKDGEIFTMYKFRTMVNDAEKISGFSPAENNDPRITKIGKFLRRSRFDELPQLFNILQGKMSLVGPRPENLHRVDTHKALQGIRLAVKPGLTGLAQVKRNYDLHPKHKVRYDFLYIQRRSFWLNAYILLQTIPAVFSKKGW